VLRDFNARFVKGKSYALVGVSGSGKSTFLDLLLGFFSPAEGGILVNGRPSDGCSRGELRGKIILVTQDAAVFNDTMENNLRLGLAASRANRRGTRWLEIHDHPLAIVTRRRRNTPALGSE